MSVILIAGNLDVKAQSYRGTLRIKEQQELSFRMTHRKTSTEEQFIIYNGAERIILKEIDRSKDSVRVRFPIFDSELVFLDQGKELHGYFHNHSRKTLNKIAFDAVRTVNTLNYKKTLATGKDFGGRWQVVFDPGKPDSTISVGEFTMSPKGNYAMTGTFLTPTGDYRYLEGVADGDTMRLSCFDGSHAFLFKAVLQADGSLKGMFWSGLHSSETWIARRDKHAAMPDADKLTFLKEGFDKVDFSFPDINGKQVSLSDDRFKDKGVILQIMGSWCPNCMDESAFLSEQYQQNKDRGLEIVGLAFERATDSTKVRNNLRRLRDFFKINYPVVYAGLASTAAATKALPMLNHVMSFPTTIFIDRKGKVVRIHTGYTGPATGEHYEHFVKSFAETVDIMLKK